MGIMGHCASGPLGIWDVLVRIKVCNLDTLPKSTRRLSNIIAALSGKGSYKGIKVQSKADIRFVGFWGLYKV